jgi:hypothetical protein
VTSRNQRVNCGDNEGVLRARGFDDGAEESVNDFCSFC